MSFIQELIRRTKEQFNREIGKFARSLVGKKVRVYRKNRLGKDLDITVTVVDITITDNGLDMLFEIKDSDGVITNVSEETEITVLE